ncbi:ATP-binding protein [Dyadobacter sp. CY107]|uniref:sensor histidine kinase n=1 Tax=Dyadobacter fanqingshengii TaxID=2906443 RepID=UPI001F31B6DB|nr:ATP-binding protein [Dyadobacter fanqingshengii]MCF2502709.1 ATP-binding protein [Dyadobacter fanqingshengii]
MSDILLIASITTVLFLLLAIFIVSISLVFQKRQVKFKQEKAALHAQYAQEILQTQIEVQNATLQLVGQELHDNIGQLLSVARINLNILEELDHQPDSRQYISQTNEIIDNSIHDLRALTRSLDGDFVKDFGLEESLSHELTRLKKTNRFFVDLNVTGIRYSLGYEKEIVLFRICQEALNNVLKHAKATKFFAELSYEFDKFTLVLKDNGTGFELESNPDGKSVKAGSGLRNMRRRSSLIGGTFTLDSILQQGTTITITIPLNEQTAHL